MGSEKKVDYFKVLGVDESSSSSEIKARYRALSKKHHPDTSGDDGAKMALINEAYATLSDPIKRLDYIPQKKHTTGPIVHNYDYQAYAQAHPVRKPAKRKHKAEPVEESKENWGFLWWYVLAIPLALIIVTFGAPLYNSLFARASSNTAQVQTSSEIEQSNATTAPLDTSSSSSSNNAPISPDNSSATINNGTPASNSATTDSSQADTRQNLKKSLYYRQLRDN